MTRGEYISLVKNLFLNDRLWYTSSYVGGLIDRSERDIVLDKKFMNYVDTKLSAKGLDYGRYGDDVMNKFVTLKREVLINMIDDKA